MDKNWQGSNAETLEDVGSEELSKVSNKILIFLTHTSITKCVEKTVHLFFKGCNSKIKKKLNILMITVFFR